MIVELFYGVLIIMIEFSGDDVHHYNVKVNELASINFSQSRISFTYKESGKEEVIDVFSDQDYIAFANWWKDNKYKVIQEMGKADTKYIHNNNYILEISKIIHK